MLSTYTDLVNYWLDMPDDVTGLAGATVGQDESILDTQNTRIQYPHLWVETPDVTFTGTDHNPAKRFSFAIAVISNDTLRNQEHDVLSATLTLLEQVWAQILADADAGTFDLVLTNSNGAVPIRQWSGDNAYGWRLELSIELPRNECLPAPEPV